MRQLESIHTGRLERNEEHFLRLRKILVPRVARLALESTSLKDMVLYGKQTNKKINRFLAGHSLDNSLTQYSEFLWYRNAPVGSGARPRPVRRRLFVRQLGSRCQARHTMRRQIRCAARRQTLERSSYGVPLFKVSVLLFDL